MFLRRFVLCGLLLLAMPVVLAYYNNYPKITKMESQLYKQTYETQDIYQRLNRIETSLYHSVQSNKSLADRVDNISNQLHISSMPGYLLRDIESLEHTNFKQVYSNESPDKRLERLEYHLVGALQDGNYPDRVNKLKTLAQRNNINNYFDNNNYAYDNSDYMEQELSEPSSKWIKVQETLMFFAPILMGIL